MLCCVIYSESTAADKARLRPLKALMIVLPHHTGAACKVTTLEGRHAAGTLVTHLEPPLIGIGDEAVGATVNFVLAAHITLTAQASIARGQEHVDHDVVEICH